MRVRLVTRESLTPERELEGDSIVIGRSPGCELVLPDPLLSRRHARLFRRNDRWYLEDLGSRNGTRLNGRPLEAATELKPGDTITVSNSSIEVLDLGTSGAPSQSPVGSGQTVVLRSTKEILGTAEIETGGTTQLAKEELRRVSQRLAVINRFYRLLDGVSETRALLEATLDLLYEYFDADAGAIYLKKESGECEIVASLPREREVAELFNSRTLVRDVAEGGMAALVLDTPSDERYGQAKSLVEAGLRSFVAAPLESIDTPLGMVVLASERFSRRFVEEDLELLTSLAALTSSRVRNLELTHEAAEASKIRQELEAARAIQERLLPTVLPELRNFELQAVNVASSGVSGDFYQVVERKAEDECVVLLADVSSKGTAAALLAAMLDSFAAEPMLEGREPEDVFTRLNRLLEERTPPEWFATAYLAKLNTRSGRLRYASAGHNPALLIRGNGEIEQLAKTGLPLGVMSGVSYGGVDATLDAGDWLVVYTDGITEAFNATKDEYGLDRLISVCLEERNATAEGMLTAIRDDVERFSDGEPRADDQTLVIFHRLP